MPIKDARVFFNRANKVDLIGNFGKPFYVDEFKKILQVSWEKDIFFGRGKREQRLS